MKIKAALIDFNDTICNTSVVEQEALKMVAQMFSDQTEGKFTVAESEEMLSQASAYVRNAMSSQAASYDTALYLQRMIESADIRSDKFQLLHRLQDAYYQHILKNIKPFDDAEEFLGWLRESGRKVALISDGTVRMKLDQLKSLNLSRYVDYLVTSEESGSNKPAPNSYMLAMHKLQLSPSELFVIGNSAELDIYGANMLGMITVEAQLDPGVTSDTGSKDRSGLFKPRYTVDSLSKVRDIIEFLESGEQITPQA